MNRICICGAGTMGSGIAQVIATAGFSTILYDISESILEKAREKINSGLQFLVEKNKISGKEKTEIIQRILFTSDKTRCRADLLIEAVIEKMEAKINLFRDLVPVNSEDVIFVSNTSSLSVSVLAKELPRPERVAGLHFFNPAPQMKLVEVVKGEQTSDEVVQVLTEFTRRLGKEPVVCRDSPGFIVNRVARPFYIESLRLVEEGLVEIPVIDRLLEARGFKMGPFKLMDLIGNDINYAVSCSVYEQLQQPERLKPSYLQKEKLEKGELGRKTGKGYYDYD
ncbi:MAG: 3-hydroxyacyl-CoA dehydrogenase family protein [Flavisolibacter sp.]